MSVTRRVWKDANGTHEWLGCRWADLDEIIAGKHVPDRDNNRSVFKEVGHIMKNYGAAWYGGLNTWPKVQQMVRDGWEEGVQKAELMREDLKLEVTGRLESIRPFWKSDEWGTHHRWERELEGESDLAWKRRVRRHTSGSSVISLGVQFGGHFEVTAEQYFWCGAQMVSAAELLTEAGFEVEVRAIVLSRFGANTQVFEVCGKEAGEALNLNNVMALTGHVGIYRSVGFVGFASSEANDGYGYGADVTSGEEQMVARYVKDGPMDPFDVFIPLAYSKADAARNVRACLAKVGEVAKVTVFDGVKGY